MKRWLVLVLACSLACSPATNEELGTGEQPVIAGRVDRAPESAGVLQIGNDRGALATGVLVAPTLVLTSRQLLVELAREDDEPFFFDCSVAADGRPVGQPTARVNDPVESGVGTREGPVKGIRVFAGGSLDLCENDLALLQLQKPIESVAPLPLRLDEPPLVGERGRMVGWGMTEESPDLQRGQGLTSNATAMQIDLDVRAVGPDTFTKPSGDVVMVPDGAFLTPPGGCHGDAGAPFLAQSGAVVGLLSSIVPNDIARPLEPPSPRDCRLAIGVFHSLFSQRGWIREAFAESGEVPWLESFSRPGELLAPCNDERECVSGLCVARVDGDGFCSQSCEAEACPDGTQCLGEPGRRACLPERLQLPPHTSSGCGLVSDGMPSGGGNYHLLSPALLALAWVRRKRIETERNDR